MLSNRLEQDVQFCGLKGPKETGCFKKFPKKAPSWYKENVVKSETASSSVEVSLTSLIPDKLGMDVPVMNGGNALAILCQENMWICNTSASLHVTWCNSGAMNIPDTSM